MAKKLQTVRAICVFAITAKGETIEDCDEAVDQLIGKICTQHNNVVFEDYEDIEYDVEEDDSKVNDVPDTVEEERPTNE